MHEKVTHHAKDLKVNADRYNVLQGKELVERVLESLQLKNRCEHAKRESKRADCNVKIVRIDMLENWYNPM